MRDGILIIQRMFPNYRKEVFDHLNRNLKIELLHSSRQNGVPEVTTEYSKQICSIRYARKESSLFLNVFPEILHKGPRIIIHEFSIGILSLIPTIHSVTLLN